MRKLLIPFVWLILCFSETNANEYFEQSANIMFDFYHNCMAPLKNPVSQCQFTPSCSEFSKQAINKYGITIGIILTADRLMRCSGGHASYDDYPFYKSKFIDKPQNNLLFSSGKVWNLGLSASPTVEQANEADTAFRFVKYLFEKGEAQNAKLELLRIQYFTTDKQVKDKSNLLLAMNEYISNKPLNSLNYLADIDKIIDSELRYKYFLMTYIASDFQNLNSYCVNISHKYYDSNKAEIFDKLLVYSYFRNSDLESSLKSLHLISSQSNNFKYDTVSQYLKHNFEKNIKSPFIAGLFSAIIPGSGYIYAGRIKEGASAFLVNGLLAAGIYSLFKSGNTGSGILTTMVAFPFYFGNILGASNAAESINNKHQQIVLSNLRNALGISFQFSPEQLKQFWE